ncbi:MAG: hypothetical protein ACKVOK_09805 [Flavobacteriales bacterium]
MIVLEEVPVISKVNYGRIEIGTCGDPRVFIYPSHNQWIKNQFRLSKFIN